LAYIPNFKIRHALSLEKNGQASSDQFSALVKTDKFSTLVKLDQCGLKSGQGQTGPVGGA
jgi:hypothetical protein